MNGRSLYFTFNALPLTHKHNNLWNSILFCLSLAYSSPFIKSIWNFILFAECCCCCCWWWYDDVVGVVLLTIFHSLRPGFALICLFILISCMEYEIISADLLWWARTLFARCIRSVREFPTEKVTSNLNIQKSKYEKRKKIQLVAMALFFLCVYLWRCIENGFYYEYTKNTRITHKTAKENDQMRSRRNNNN